MTDEPAARLSPTVQPLAIGSKDAAKALGISERLLWSMTNQRLIPHTRFGRRVLYPVADLEAWLHERTSSNAGPTGECGQVS